MNTTAMALLGYIAWMLVLITVMATLRSALTLAGARKANSFTPAGDDVSPFSARLCRAHANCYEHFPIIGGLLLYALVTQQAAVTDGLALYLLGARLLQSSVHLCSTAELAVYLRFLFYLIQYAICVYWVIGFLL